MDVPDAPCAVERGKLPLRPVSGKPPIFAKNRTKMGKMTSTYDFVKVRVWLPGKTSHYYILSRYLVSRVLTVIKIPYVKAVKMALELKKHLVDTDALDIPQDQFESTLFDIMRQKGYGCQYIERYRMINKFFHQKCPVVILICGAPSTGKSTLAQRLAEKLNLPNVLQTDLIWELMTGSGDSPVHGVPVWQRTDLSETGMLNEYQRECCIIRKGVDGEIKKVLKEGKSMIFEGMHLDPRMYISDFAQQGIHIAKCAKPHTPKRHCNSTCSECKTLTSKFAKLGPGGGVCETNECIDTVNNDMRENGHRETSNRCLWNNDSGKVESTTGDGKAEGLHQKTNELDVSIGRNGYVESCLGDLRSPFLDCDINSIENQAQATGDVREVMDRKVSECGEHVRDLQPVFIPIVIGMEEMDHRVLFQQSCMYDSRTECMDLDEAFQGARSLHRYLCEERCMGVTVFNAEIVDMTKVLDELHDHFLKCIECAMGG